MVTCDVPKAVASVPIHQQRAFHSLPSLGHGPLGDVMNSPALQAI
jgi:hypothetical protein